MLATNSFLSGIEWQKRCSKCGKEKPATIEFFYPGLRYRDGLVGQCRECLKLYHADRYAAATVGRIKKKPGRKPLPEAERRQRQIEWIETNRERRNTRRRELRKENPERQKLRYQRRHANPVQSLSSAMRSSIRRAFTVKKLSSDKDSRSWESLVGYTAHDLIAHIEKQFQRRMTWRNFGEWHIDHIRPVSSFNFQSVDDPEFRVCWALPNLRPMWGDHNLRKAAARIYLV